MNDGTGKNVGKASKKKTPKHLRPSSSGPPPDKPQCNCAQLRAIAHAPCKQQPVDPEILRLPIPRAKGQQSSPGQQGFVPQRGDCPVHGNVLGALLTARCSEPFCTAAGPRQLKQKKKKKKKKEPYEMYTSDSEESLDSGTLQTGQIKEQKKSGLDKPSHGDTGTLQTGKIKEQKKSGLDKPSLGDTGTLQTGQIKEQKKSGLDKPSHGDTGTLQTGKIKEQKKSGIDKPSHGACGIVPDMSKLERSSVPEARESMAFSSVSSPQERPGTGTEQKSKRHKKKKKKNKLKNTSPAACATGSDASELYQPRESKAHDNPVRSSADAAEQGKRAQQTVTVTCTKAQKAPQQSSTLDGMDKRVKTAAKSLRKLQRKIDDAMKKSEDYGEQLFLGVDKLTTNRGEAEKALKDHVTQLHSLLDQHFQHHLESLRQRHKEHLQQVLITRTEEMNHQGKLAHLQREVEDLLKLVTESHDATTDPNVEVSALRTKFNQTDTQKPDAKMKKLTFAVETPEANGVQLDALMGRFVFVEEFVPHTQPSSPPAKEDKNITLEQLQQPAFADCSTVVLQFPEQPDFTPFAPSDVAASVQSDFLASAQSDFISSADADVAASVKPDFAASAQSYFTASAHSNCTASVQSDCVASEQPEFTEYALSELITASVKPDFTASAQSECTASAEADFTASAYSNVTASVQSDCVESAQPNFAASAQSDFSASAPSDFTSSAQSKVVDDKRKKNKDSCRVS